MCGIGLSPPNPLKIHRERKKKSRWGERKHKTCLFPGSTMLKKCTFLVMVSLVPAGSAVRSLYMSQVIRYQSHLSSHHSLMLEMKTQFSTKAAVGIYMLSLGHRKHFYWQTIYYFMWYSQLDLLIYWLWTYRPNPTQRYGSQFEYWEWFMWIIVSAEM